MVSRMTAAPDGLADKVGAGAQDGDDGHDQPERLAVKPELEKLGHRSLAEFPDLGAEKQGGEHQADGGAPVGQAIHIAGGIGLAGEADHADRTDQRRSISTRQIEPGRAPIHVVVVSRVVVLVPGYPGVYTQTYQQYNRKNRNNRKCHYDSPSLFLQGTGLSSGQILWFLII